ncbi:hypothetical protein COOONC_07046 [Cooperia oncophora]
MRLRRCSGLKQKVAPQHYHFSRIPQDLGQSNAHAASSVQRKHAGAEAVVDGIGGAETRKSLPKAAAPGLDEANGTTSNPSSARISVKQERISLVLSDTVRHFIFTAVQPSERLRLSNIISRLGGIADSGELSDACTHLICGKLVTYLSLFAQPVEELRMLVSVGAKVFSLEYIAKFLLEENVDETSSYHADYKKFLQYRRK